jgi:hypothetical protein
VLAVARRWLASPRAPWAILALALALVAPALGVGFATDDHLHRILSRREPVLGGFAPRPLDLFVFADGTNNSALMNQGVFPWWARRDAKLAFMRPLSSLTHAVDHRLWPESAPLAQAHGLLWYALSLGGLWAVYRRLFDARWAAALALALYALDDARGPTVGWIANRNATIALALALPVLLVYRRARSGSWRRGALLGPLLLAVALCAGESALAICAYLVAHAIHLEDGPWRRRAAGLYSYLGVILVWRLVYVMLGYGVAHSGVYIDPGREPLGFAAALVQRLPLLLGAQLGGAWSDLAGLYPFLGAQVPAIMLGLSALTLAGFAWLAAPLLRADPLSRFFATGMVLAAVPICSTFPADRLLGFVGVGGMGLLARFFQHALGEVGVPRPPTRAMALLLAVLLLAVSPPLLVLRARGMISVEALARRAESGIPRDAAIRDKTVVIVNSPGDAFLGYARITRASLGIPQPKALRWLATGLTAVSIERTGAASLLVRPEGGFLQFEMDRMLRKPDDGFARGETVRLLDWSFHVVEATPEGRPLAVHVAHEKPLDDTSLLWRRWSGSGLVPYRLPAVGQREVLPAIDLLALLGSTGGSR